MNDLQQRIEAAKKRRIDVNARGFESQIDYLAEISAIERSKRKPIGQSAKSRPNARRTPKERDLMRHVYDARRAFAEYFEKGNKRLSIKWAKELEDRQKALKNYRNRWG